MKKSQIEFIHEIAALHAGNPELEIHICVDSDETLEGRWTAHKITSVDVDYWYADDERILTDETEIREHFEYEMSEDKSLSESEIDMLVENKFASVNKAILVYTHAG